MRMTFPKEIEKKMNRAFNYLIRVKKPINGCFFVWKKETPQSVLKDFKDVYDFQAKIRLEEGLHPGTFIMPSYES